MEESKRDILWDKFSFDDIELGDIIGGGGVGLVYSGWIKGRNEAVAFKTLFDSRVNEELRREYLDELQVLSRVNHSNIVSFLGACITPPNLFFVMELCVCSLFDIIHKNKESFENLECIRMAIDISSAMEYLHSLKPAIIHRDLKSLNILQAYDGSLKLCDFGLVKVKNAQAGTPAYMAPELLDGKPYNKSVDVYAFGVLLCEIFSSQIPFFMMDYNAIRQRVLNGNRPQISNKTPTECVSLIRDAWNGEAKNRPEFPDIVDRLLELQNIYSHQTLLNPKTPSNLSEVDSLDFLLRK